ncbi:MAG: ABC transporter permease [Gemmataceae bacterium]|nr:ABC transporter permease [Gemmataceae bacterium]
MEIFDLLVISLRQLAKNKLRSGLTVLGVVIGIAAVTTMVSIGQATGDLVRTQFQSLGANVLIVFPGRVQKAGVSEGKRASLTAADAAAVASDCPSVRAASPLVGTQGQVIGGNVNWKPNELLGVGPDYLAVRNWPMASGAFLSERDVLGATKNCVIGHTIAQKLFPGADPMGQQIRIRNIPFTITGVLAKKGANMVGQDQDDIILMPWTTVRKRLQGSNFANVDVILVSARSEDSSAKAEQEMSLLLNERHKISPGERSDFHVENTAEIAKVLNVITSTMTAMLSAIAAISLVVGGVGIMNIMLVSVTERTREIGLRMALGARPRDILWQFLVEAVVLSCVGGAIGIAMGISASYAITAGLNAMLPDAHWPFVVSVPAAIIALVFAGCVGVFFGFYPARRASRLDPIEALRYD